MRRPWYKLPPVSFGFTRIPDAADGRRMVRCDKCGRDCTSLGVGYHKQNCRAWNQKTAVAS